ncbi:MAG: cysteine desulfurase family protein [Candidatus Liptonbacteria bacterium]|nr:cysteine desulfurase family protein [Candidatus Liptonbacteria bacterium]
MGKKIYYFDYAATTPVRPEVFSAMKPYMMREFGNPSNLYSLGRNARTAIFEATKKIADVIGCRLDEFVFTGSATESDNIALLGVARANRLPAGQAGAPGKIIVSNVEHKGILAVCEALQKEGFKIQELPVGTDGLVRPEDLERMLDEETVLVSVTSADSETGSLQPIAELSRVIGRFREARNRKTPYFHTDASQAAVYADINAEALGVDLITLSAHKLYGPKGIGGLFVRKGTNIAPIIFGGGQQGRLRSGTENIPGIVGFGEAMRLVALERTRDAKRVGRLRDTLEKGIFASIPKVLLNGHPTKRLPNFFNVSILDVEGEALLLHLDDKNIFINTGSACNSESLEPSYVIMALGRPYEFVHGSLRFTLGKDTTLSDVKYVLRELPDIVKELRKISPLNLSLDHTDKIAQPKAFVGGQTPHFLRKKK